MPVCSAAPCPRLIGCRTTTAPASNATSPVRSPEPSSTTTTAYPARRMPDTTLPTTGASLYAATTIQGLRIRPIILIKPQQAQDARDHRDSDQETRRQRLGEHQRAEDGRQRNSDRHERISARQRRETSKARPTGRTAPHRARW